MIKVTADWLQSSEALKDVPINQLDWLIENSNHYILNKGEFLFKPESAITGTHIVIEGKIRLYVLQNNEFRELLIVEPKGITGYLPFSRGKMSISYCEAKVDTQLMTLPIEKTTELIQNYFELTQAFVQIMTTRVRDYTALMQQNEKMMALGKLSAGLAHELNNPAAAVVRGSVSLKNHLKLSPETFKQIIAATITAEEVDYVNERMFYILNKNDTPILNMLQRTDLEDDVSEWMKKHQIENYLEISENFVDYGFRINDLNDFETHLNHPCMSPVFNWINNNLITEKIVTDIEESSRRISELVGSIKTFTHMDQGHDKKFANIHEGILNTVKMLNHKFKKGNIQLKENFDYNLPPVKALIGELNQVWTNLIDNALDAMEANGNGILEIKTVQDNEFVQVSIIDNGPGIPADIQSKIFDPFFTTKEIGKGTGLGLDVVLRIIKQHRGSIKLNSTPDHTEFTICFPING